MSEFFLTIVNMSISASWIVIAVLILRLFLKKAPKWITVMLWGIVAIRLIVPFTIESVMSLIPSVETINPEIMTNNTPTINSGIPIINNAINPIFSEFFAPDPAGGSNPLQIWIPVLSVVWVVGITGMLLYTIISYFRVKRKISTAVLLCDNIFQSQSVVSPFVLGIIKPKIYLPFSMNDKDTEYVVAHEQAHISRKDHWWKPLGFLLLTLHWFNPLMWFGYVLLCKDIEFACDEKVIKELDIEKRADYSQVLLDCSVNRHNMAACPLAFGEVDVKNRVKSILNYRRPALWIVLSAIVASIVVAVCFLTNPKTTLNDVGSADIPQNVIVGTSVDQLRVKYPQFFNMSTDGGLTVYIWQMAENSYSCHLANTFMESASDNSSFYEVGTSIAEMRSILTTYEIDQKDITIQPITNPLSSYYYEINDAYRTKIKERFWATIPLTDASQHSSVIDTVTFDIDGDGTAE